MLIFFLAVLCREALRVEDPPFLVFGETIERGRLMYSLRKERSGLSLTWEEMKDARERARLHLKSQARR
jgi:hypothetical protein